MKKLKNNRARGARKSVSEGGERRGGGVKGAAGSRLTSVVFLDGKFLPAEEAMVSVFDHGFLYGDGVYETLRIGVFVRDARGRVDNEWKQATEAKIRRHLARLRKSAEAVGITVPWSDAALTENILGVARLNKFKQSRVRVQVTRGRNGYEFTTCPHPTLCILATELKPEPAKVYTSGVDVVTVKAERLLPEVKSLNFLPLIYARQIMKKHNAYEALYIDHSGNVREGTMTNVFIVKAGVLTTPQMTDVLHGTTRHAVLELARELGVKVEEAKVSLAEMKQADEIFLTNVLKGIVPVARLDSKKVGLKGENRNNGRGAKKSALGPVTKKLMDAFAKRRESGHA